MLSNTPSYITAAGAFLPGSAVDNDAMEERLGLVNDRASRYRKRVLRSNGITSRYYAIDVEGRQTCLNEELAAEAVRNALKNRGIGAEAVSMLSLGTTMPDVLMPGFASMVHGRLGGGPMECLSSGGVCASSFAALKAAHNAIRLGEHQLAVAGGSELASPLLRGSRFAAESELANQRDNPSGSFAYFNADFLRWMLSDGAGALVLEPRPRSVGLSLRIEWLSLRSYAHEYPTCMYLGTSNNREVAVGNTLWGYSSFAEAEQAGVTVIRQDTQLLEQGIVDIVPRELRRLTLEGKVDPGRVDWFLPHVSSYFMVEKLKERVKKAGISENRVFTNLKTKGNMGAASIYVMLEEALAQGMFSAGEQVLLMVPESGRMTACYGLLSVVGPNDTVPSVSGASSRAPYIPGEGSPLRGTRIATSSARGSEPAVTPKRASVRLGAGARTAHSTSPAALTTGQAPMNPIAPFASPESYTEAELQAALERSPLGRQFAGHPGEVQRFLATELALVWQQFEQRLNTVPIVRAIEDGQASVEDYRLLLINLRQQVIEGGRWIAQIAASMGPELFVVRSTMIRHAAEEHRDYQILEKNYVAAGGHQEDIENAPKNVGSEAFSAYMFYRSAQPNPLGLFGAMFIIEGLGAAKAARWGRDIQQSTGLPDAAVTFLSYHGENDDDHYEKLRMILSAPFITEGVARDIVKTAKTVGRLYCLQLEELGHH